MTVDVEIASFLRHVGGDTPSTITPLHGGANNRVYRVDAPSGSTCVKWFAEPSATHDRFEHEITFVRAIAEAAGEWIPRLLASSRSHRMAQYELIDGVRPAAEAVTPEMVSVAAAFLAAVNRTAPTESARIGHAVDACFSIADNLAGVDRRVERLRTAELEGVCHTLVQEGLVPTWSSVRAAAANGPEQAAGDRWLSPSDIGFHNSLSTAGRLVFVDFEYAGWDDPAKTIADFFAQPDYTVDAALLPAFAREAGVSPQVAGRARALVPVERVRWSCIVLNDFIEPAASRRRQSLGTAAWEARRLSQIEKAAGMLRIAARETASGGMT